MQTSQRPMGFLRLVEPKTRKSQAALDGDNLLHFDDGNSLTFQEATFPTVVLGGTGRGKTESVILPAAARLIESGAGGLVIDIKNNFTDRLRHLAGKAGRAHDIVEIGNHPTAASINLFEGLSPQELAVTLESMSMDGGQNDPNGYWRLKGAQIASDVAVVLDLIAKRQPERGFRLTPALLSWVLNDYGTARKAWNLYREQVHNPDSLAEAQMVGRVKSEQFHPFLNNEGKGSRESEFGMQISWLLRTTRMRLGQIVEDETMLRNLSAVEPDISLDFGRSIFEDRKIVVLRFTMAQTSGGSWAAKALKERFYKAAFERFDREGLPKERAFFLGDEFQDIMSLDRDTPFNDFAWFSKSREFKVINLVATQALSSLYEEGNRDRVNSMLSNSNLLVLQTQDPAVDAFFRSFIDLERPIQHLGAGEIVLSKFDLSSRRQVVRHDHVNGLYEQGRSRLQGFEFRPAKPMSGDDQALDGIHKALLAVQEQISGLADVPEGWCEYVGDEDTARWLWRRHQPYIRGLQSRKPEECPPVWIPALLNTMKRWGVKIFPDKTLTVVDMSVAVSFRDNPRAQGKVRRLRVQLRRMCSICGHYRPGAKPRSHYYFDNDNEQPTVSPLCPLCNIRVSGRGVRGRAKKIVKSPGWLQGKSAARSYLGDGG